MTQAITDVGPMRGVTTSRTSYGDVTTADVVVKQTFTQKPAGESYSHYGYLFATAFYDDGTSEELLYEDTKVDVITPNLIVTANGYDDNQDHYQDHDQDFSS